MTAPDYQRATIKATEILIGQGESTIADFGMFMEGYKE